MGQGCPRTRDGTRPGGIDVHRTPAPSLPPHCSWRAACARAASHFGPRASLRAGFHRLPPPPGQATPDGQPESLRTHLRTRLQTGETTGTCKEDAGRDARGPGMEPTLAESMSIGGLLPHLPPHCFWGAACAQAARHFGPRASLPAGSHRLPLPRSGHPEQATRKPTHPKAALQTGETNGMCKEDAGADTRGPGMEPTPAESMSIGGLLPHLPPHCL